MRKGLLCDIDERHLDNGPLVSIIVPVYNTPEGPLRRCLKSLFVQDYHNIEFIIVDDGSDEGCRAVLDDVLSSEPRSRIIAGGHRGVSHARNVGIDAAEGEWIAFSDADDEVESCFVYDALKVALAEESDFVCGSVAPLFQDSALNRGAYSQEYCVVDEKLGLTAAGVQMLGPVKYQYFTGPDFSGRGPVAKLYKMAQVGNLRFDEGIPIGEDNLFNYRYIERCRSMVIVDSLWYLYYQYEGSAVHAADLKPWKCSLERMLANREKNESLVPFDSRCSFMAAQVVEILARSTRVFNAGRKGSEMLAFASSCGCFSGCCLEGYELSPWLAHFILLCKRGHFRRASWFWIVRTLAKDRLANQKLIDPRSVPVFGKR